MVKVWITAVCVTLASSACDQADKVAPKVESQMQDAKRDVALLQARSLANEAYVQWAMRHQGCPASIADLLEYTVQKDARDPWGNDYQLLCGDAKPAAATGVGVRSSGPDGKPGTDDDVTSW